MECGARSEVAQANDEDGYPALQDARVSAEGNLDAYPGLQSDPHDHRTSRQPTRSETTISFKGAIQSFEAFQPLIAMPGERDAAFRRSLYEQLLDAIATHSVADRPNRFEPRLRKRRQKKYDRMMKPRHEIKRHILKRLKEN